MAAGLLYPTFGILLAAILPLVCAGLSKWRGFKVSHRDGGYDNHDPRAWLARQTLAGLPGNCVDVTGAAAGVRPPR